MPDCDTIRTELEQATARVEVLTEALKQCEETPDFTRRGYVIQQVQSRTECLNYRDEFEDVHATVPAVNGGGIRVPWKAYDADKSILQAGADISEPFEHYSVRIMAGRHTPTAKMGRTLTENGTTYPSPFGDTAGNPNEEFLDHMEATMREWAQFLADTGQPNPILHWSWYAKEWAEIYHGPAVRSAPGYSKTNFVNAQCAIIGRAAAVQADFPSVLMELPMSGHGPIADLTDDMTRCVAEVFDDQRAAIQANGWSYRGQWGQQDPAVDTQMDAAFEVAWANQILVGVQAIQPWGQNTNYPQYNPTQITQAFEQADLAKANYFEIYTPTLLSRNGGTVWTDPVADWLAG